MMTEARLAPTTVATVVPRASGRASPERPSMALAPRETGLHLGPHDSIGGVNQRSAASRWVQTTRAGFL